MENKFKKTKEDFSLNVSALSTYTDETSMELGQEIIMNADTIQKGLISIKYGAKGHKVALPLIKNTVYVTAGGCGTFTASGTTTFAEPQITMFPLSVQDSICPKTLKEYFYDLYMADSYTNTDNLGKYEDVFVKSKMASAAKEYGKILWRGANATPAYASVTGNLLSADGLLQVAYANSASTVNVAKTAITVANGVVVLDSILSSIATNAPALITECNLYASPVDFQNICMSILKTYPYTVNVNDMKSLESIFYPGSIGLTIVKVNDLEGVASGTFLATRKDNIWGVISEAGDLEFKIWYSNDAREYRMESSVKIGAGFYQPELLVKIA